MEAELHPHAHNQGPNATSSGSKEGLSVYGLFHHLARTPQGKQRLRQMFLRPLLDLNGIVERHRTIGTLLRTENDTVRGGLTKSFKSIKNMKPVMMHLRKGVSASTNKTGGIRNGVWSTIRHFAFYAIEIQTCMLALRVDRDLLIKSKVLERFDIRQIAAVGRDITDIIDFAESAEKHRTVVKLGVNDDLDTLKRTYAGIESLLDQCSLQILADAPGYDGPALNVVFLPQLCFLIAIHHKGPALSPQAQAAIAEWQHIYTGDEAVYYKDNRMHELDAKFGDVVANICDVELEIVHDLAQRVLECEDMICEISDICGEVDTLVALAEGAKLYKLARPRMTSLNIIDIVKGRHVLQEQATSNFIPNDTLLKGGSGAGDSQVDVETQDTTQVNSVRTRDTDNNPSMMVLTGPNYSGKSCMLKQIALIVYMAHVGSFVPAETATIGLTDRILTRIWTRETVSKAQSAFMIDLQQIASAIALATRRSLILIDEFGKGTDSIGAWHVHINCICSDSFQMVLALLAPLLNTYSILETLGRKSLVQRTSTRFSKMAF